MTWLEKIQPTFQAGKSPFQRGGGQVDRYKVTTMGHSLNGEMSKNVNDKKLGAINANVVFSHGSRLMEPFHKKQCNKVDISNKYYVITLSACLTVGKQMIKGSNKGVLGSYKWKQCSQDVLIVNIQ